MNEQRAMKTKFLTNRMESEKDMDWSSIKARLEALRSLTSLSRRYDLNTAIIRMLVVINKNQPNKKLLKSITKRIFEIEQELAKTQYQKTK